MARRGTSSDYLYRITSLSNVADLFQSRELHLASPRCWMDPFETILLHKRSHALFAQCWCKKSVSDAMWKVFSPDCRSIRIRTSRFKLAELASTAPGGTLDVWLQDVKYHSPTKIRAQLIRLADQLTRRYSIFQSKQALFWKRDAFQHEFEVRLLVHDRRLPDNGPPQECIRLPVDPHHLIESIMFDSRVEESFYREKSEYLRDSVGFRGSIGKSALYRLQRQLIVQ